MCAHLVCVREGEGESGDGGVTGGRGGGEGLCRGRGEGWHTCRGECANLGEGEGGRGSPRAWLWHASSCLLVSGVPACVCSARVGCACVRRMCAPTPDLDVACAVSECAAWRPMPRHRAAATPGRELPYLLCLPGSVCWRVGEVWRVLTQCFAVCVVWWRWRWVQGVRSSSPRPRRCRTQAPSPPPPSLTVMCCRKSTCGSSECYLSLSW